ncbi:MAG: GNAT family N-acetyltransferase [Clostridia bacterium]|nr:GNAT family N-acetyltransferase [Clostridia bacterium]
MIKNIKQIFNSEEIYNIYSACMFNPTFEKFKTKALTFKNNINIEIYGYFVGKEIIGVIATEESEKQVEIIGIAVDAKNQNYGIGTKLINYIRDNTNKQIFAETDNDAIGFYKKYGFNITEQTVSKNGDTFTRYLCHLKN